ncbi:Six-hairpin glycosidase [Lactarius psammicola]|nr:Six-hairpin glycosidase [Lactarius psammicola]
MYISCVAISALFLLCVSAQGLTSNQIDTVKQLLAEVGSSAPVPKLSSSSLLLPSLCLLHRCPFPPPSSLDYSLNDALADVFTIARNVVTTLPPPPSNGTGQPLVLEDGSAGDPASIGTAVLIANWTGLGSEDYAGAATAQVEYLFGPAVPKTPDGAISHRVSEVQLWSDSVYMVPPFLAYYGIATGNQSMLQEAYNQVKLYRNYLGDSSAGGLWRHIVLGTNGTDPGHWSTGNAWAAAGMLRVLGTLKSSSFSRNFKGQLKDLGNWVAEIHSAMYPHLQANGLFKNYADGNSTENFDDASSSALLAATVYRLALLTGNETFVHEAERTRAALYAGNGTSATSSDVPVVTTPSTLWPSSTTPSSIWSAAGSASYGVECVRRHATLCGAQSPEGQAFVLMLESAWRDWSAASSARANVAPNMAPNVALPSARAGLSTVLLGAIGLVVACTMTMMDGRAVLFSI